MVEVIVAVVILAFGLAGLAGTTGLLVRQSTLADLTTERAVARQSVLESIRAQPFDEVRDSSSTVGGFSVSWTVIESDDWYKTVELVTTGQGLRSGGEGLPVLGPSVADTATFHVVSVE